MVKLEQGVDARPAPQAINVLDWDGKDDPDNPRNFTLKRRIISTATVTFLAFVSTLGGSIYAPSHDEVSRSFKVSDEIAILPLSLYNAGLAFGPLIGAPLSSLITCRFFAGVFASPAISNASATIVDYTAGRYRAVSLAFYYSVPFFGAVVGPLIGGFLVESKGWRWTQWATLFFIVAFYIPIIFTKESYKKTILQRRAKKRGVTYPTTKRTLPESIKYFAMTLFLRPLHMIATEPIVTLVCMYNGFMFGLLYTMVVASPWVYQHYYGFGLTGQSLSFLGLITGTVLAPFPLILIDLSIYQPRLKKWKASQHLPAQDTSGEARFPPENRLFPAMIGSFLLPSSLLGFAWTVRPSIHYIVPIIFQCFSLLFALIIYASANLFMLDAYGPLYGASAAGAAMLSRYTLSCCFPLFALQMYSGLGVGWATTILACCTAALAPIPWCFWKWGEGLRGRMKYESSA
ncbi:hypothetical protein LTR24_008649 [Lithohypha guttulata]|uniref:Major facilitator superfamily (MFS) profile domain-containing protein n=1 Tax=Lithohypha guttulata TaxID=1690604 RepID=A0ABR0JZD7_9EURO|nr:hypothetical protein LTR24_008649 [Lithohypha guttulata]